MKENLLQFIWRLRLFPSNKFLGTRNERIEILSPGIQNFNSGPDFLNAKVRIDDQVWFGNVEIHVDATDWYSHHHEIDENYDSVILHVVWIHSIDVYNKSNDIIPTLCIKDYVPSYLLNSYENLMNRSTKWINCEKEIGNITSLSWTHWTDFLFYERLEEKLSYFEDLQQKNKNDWEATLFVSLARNFGLKINEGAFHRMAESIPFSIVRKLSKNRMLLEALFFGQAGLLSKEGNESYYLQLQKEYVFLKKKFGLIPVSKTEMQFFRLRPISFPTIRISQFAGLYHRHQVLFSKILESNKISNFYELFNAETSEFWLDHYTFETSSQKKVKRISKSLVHSIILNTLIPLKFLYQKSHGNNDAPMEIDLALQLESEKNNIISNYRKVGVPCNSAYESQALLQLNKNYCVREKCLDCEIGKELLIR